MTQVVLDVRDMPPARRHQAIFEAWAALPGIRPTAGAKCRFDILLGQYDSGNRVCMERMGRPIVNANHDPAAPGWLLLAHKSARPLMLVRTVRARGVWTLGRCGNNFWHGRAL